jgi:hypothetical protein
MADGFKMDDQDQVTNSPNPSVPNTPSQPTAVTTQQALLGAVEASFVAQRTRAMANLNSYLLSPAGVAEHPDIVGEVIALIKDISEADGHIQTLRRIVS